MENTHIQGLFTFDPDREQDPMLAQLCRRPLLVVLLFVNLLSPAIAQGKLPSDLLNVAAAVPRNFPPHYAVGKAGKPEGFAIDIMERITADERRLKQVMVNLLSNADKFTPDGGAIKLEAEKKGEEVVVSVEDTGIGVAPEAFGD